MPDRCIRYAKEQNKYSFIKRAIAMKINRYAKLLALTVTLALTVFICLAPAQDKPADTMQIARGKIKADKKLFISENMKLTESEAKAFWPVYEKYQKELGKLNDRNMQLIQDYAANYESLSNATAKKLVDNHLAIQGERVKLMQSYLSRFRRVLPEVKVARYYQLENKANAIVNNALAELIPLVK
jgi:hypothetical protein